MDSRNSKVITKKNGEFTRLSSERSGKIVEFKPKDLIFEREIWEILEGFGQRKAISMERLKELCNQ